MFNSDFDIKDFKEKVNRLPDDATIQDVLKILLIKRMAYTWVDAWTDKTILTFQTFRIQNSVWKKK